MFPLNEFLADLAIFTLVFAIAIVATTRWKPRIKLHDFPADIQALAAPKTAEEKRLTALIGISIIAVFFALPILLTRDLKSTLGTSFSFVNAWVYASHCLRVLICGIWLCLIGWVSR